MKRALNEIAAYNREFRKLAQWLESIDATDVIVHADYITQDPRYMFEYWRLGVTFTRNYSVYVIDMDEDDSVLAARDLDLTEPLSPGKNGLSKSGPPVFVHTLHNRKEMREHMMMLATDAHKQEAS